VSSDRSYPCTWDQNDALTWEANGNIGHGSTERTWSIEPALDPGKVRQAWLHIMSENPAMAVDYSLGKDGFWRQKPRPAADYDQFVIDAPNCDNTTREFIKSRTGPMKDRTHSLIIDTRADRTVLHLFIDHIPIDGYSGHRVLRDFSRYLSGAECRGGADMQFFEFCSRHGAMPETCGALALDSVITPYESIPRSREPANPALCATAVRKYALPIERIPMQIRRSMAGIAPAIGAVAIARAAGDDVSEIPTLVTVPNRRPDTLDAFGRFLGYTMIALPAAEPDISVAASKIHKRILAAAKPRVLTPMSRVVAALAPHRMSSKFKQPERMLPYMAIDHSAPEPELAIAEHRTQREIAGPEIYLGACAVYSSANEDDLLFTVAIRTDHLSMSVFDTVEDLLSKFGSRSADGVAV
jgi:hypothetical protein